MAWQEREKEWDNLQEVFRLIGHISMQWSRIDLSLVGFIANLTDISPAQAAVFLDGNLPKKKVHIAKKLIKVHAPEGKWRKDAEKTLSKIGSDLNDRRNRYIHDVFQFDVDKISRARVGEVAGKIEPNFENVTKDELGTWCDEALDAWEELEALTQKLVPWIYEQQNEQ